MKRLLTVRELTPAMLVVVAFVVGAIESPYFLDLRYLLDASSLYVEGGLLALGMTLVIICGGIDLSVAAMLALCSVIFARLAAHAPAPVAVLGTLLFGALLGGINGSLVGWLKLPSFAVTLATMAAYRGIAQVMLGPNSDAVPSGLMGLDMRAVPGVGIPLPLSIFLVLALVVGVVLHKSVPGRWMFATGTNERASFLSGVPTAGLQVVVFGVSGFMAAIAGMFIDSRLGVARWDHATGLEVDVITAVVLGGASIYGGKGSILGTLLALLLLALVRVGMGLANVTAEYQLAAVGTLLIVAVVAGIVSDRFTGARAS